MNVRIYFSVIVLVLVVCWLNTAKAQETLPSSQQQVMAAVSAAPESLQAEATVLGYNADSTFASLKEGTNNLICIADDPAESEFHVACYHKDLDPFMKRGRELKAKGMSRQEIDLIRRSEIKSGKITMPEKPMALYALNGPADVVDYEEGTIEDVSPLYVIYIPYATEKSTGLPPKPESEGAPWLMEPGTPWAHIMVMTGREVSKEISLSTD